MKLFKTIDEASQELRKRAPIYIPKACPFMDDDLCGNWCALFGHDIKKKTIALNCGISGVYPADVAER